MGSALPNREAAFAAARAEFEDIETRLGELAAFISDVADGLIDDPEMLPACFDVPWPDIAALLKLRATWIERRDALLAAWRQLEPSRRKLHPLPPFGAIDRSRAVI